MAFSMASAAPLTPWLNSVANCCAISPSSGIPRSWFIKSISATLISFFAGRNAVPTSIFIAWNAFAIILSMAPDVLALMMNSRSMLPVYRLGSFTIASASVNCPRFPVSLAAPWIAHCPNSVFRAATCLSASMLPIASNTSIMVPVASTCIDFATPSAVKPSDSHISFWAFVALDPRLRFVYIRLILVAALLPSTPIASIDVASAAVLSALIPAIWPSAAESFTTWAISAAVVALFAPR